MENKQEDENCSRCNGRGELQEIVDHDHNCDSVWDFVECWQCNGTGKKQKAVD